MRSVLHVILILSLLGCGQPTLPAPTATSSDSLFAALDLTGSGELTPEGTGFSKDLFETIDRDQDGRIVRAEWARADRRAHRQLLSDLRKGLDRNGDRFVGPEEARGTWLEEGFKMADSNRDSRLSEPEIGRFLSSPGAQLHAKGIGLVAGIGAGALGLALGGYMAYAAMKGSHDLMYPEKSTFTKSPAAYGLPFETVRFMSHDGLALTGWYVPAAVPTTKGVMLLHGHGSNKDTMFHRYGQWLHERYNVFVYDARYHGESEGRFTTLGYYERQDVPLAIAEFRRRGTNELGLLGESMGAAIAIEAGAASEHVKAVVEDSAFDSLEDAVAPRVARKKYPFAGPVAKLIVKAASLRAKGDLPQADPIRWVGHLAPRPLLIIHGQKDDETTPMNGEKLFDAARDPKHIWRTPEARHAESWKLYPEEYRNRVLGFFEQAL